MDGPEGPLDKAAGAEGGGDAARKAVVAGEGETKQADAVAAGAVGAPQPLCPLPGHQPEAIASGAQGGPEGVQVGGPKAMQLMCAGKPLEHLRSKGGVGACVAVRERV